MASMLSCLLPRHGVSRLSAAVNAVMCIQTRNTIILKRKYPIMISKLNSKRWKMLKPKHFVYEVVEDTELTEQPHLPVVLTTFVEGIGDIGDVVHLPATDARQELLLPKKAVYASPENIAEYGKLKELSVVYRANKMIQGRIGGPRYSSVFAAMTSRFLAKKLVPVIMNEKVPWTIEAWHIRIAFRKEGIVIPEHSVQLPEQDITGPDPVKEGRDFAVTITINNTEKVLVRCRIYHMKSGYNTKHIVPEDSYTEIGDPILPEQEELLDSMPPPEVESVVPDISPKNFYKLALHMK